MRDSYSGGCACGEIHYEITAEPIVMTDCQCRDCQAESGTGHASHLVFRHEAVSVTGKAKLWDMKAGSGHMKTRAFCPECGSPVYMTFSAMPDVFAVRAASLDDPSRYKPQMVTFTSRGHSWDRLDPALPKFETMPPG